MKKKIHCGYQSGSDHQRRNAVTHLGKVVCWFSPSLLFFLYLSYVKKEKEREGGPTNFAQMTYCISPVLRAEVRVAMLFLNKSVEEVCIHLYRDGIIEYIIGRLEMCSAH